MPLPAEQRPEHYAQMIDLLFSKVPFKGDETENETVLEFALQLKEVDQEAFMQYIRPIAATCVYVLTEDRCADSLQLKVRRRVAKFIAGDGMAAAPDTFKQLADELEPL